MDVSCYTVRPGPNSGWLTFFELAHRSRGPGFFLVIGPAAVPASGPDPDQRRYAQETARSIVNAYKSLRDPSPGEWLAAVRRLVASSRIPLEYGAVLGAGEQIYFFVEGRVRLVPLTAAPRHRWEKDAPRTGELAIRRIEGGDRYLLARLPRDVPGMPSLDLLEGIERGGAGDGALILTFHGAAVETTSSKKTGRESAPAPAVEAPATMSVAAPVVETPVTASMPPPIVELPRPAIQPPITETLPVVEKAPAEAPPPPVSAEAPPVVSSVSSSLPEPPPPIVHPPRRQVPVPDFEKEKPSAGVGRYAAWILPSLAVVMLGVYFVRFRSHEAARSSVPVPREESAPAAASLAGPAPGEVNTPILTDSVTMATPGAPAPTGPVPTEAGLLWTARLPAAVTASPLVAGDNLVVGCRDGWVYGLDATNGSIRWRFQGTKGFGGNLAKGDSLVYAGCFDGIVRALDPKSGSLAWQFSTAGRIVAAPVLGEGRVIAVSYDHTAYALETGTGKLLWKTRLGGILWATPSLGRKLLYVPGLDGVVAAVNPKWGSVAWRFKARDEIYSAPLATDSLVVFGCEDGSVYAVDPEYGRLQWKTGIGKPVGGGVAGRDGVFFVGDDAGVMHALSGETGKEVWSYRAGGSIKSTPVVDGDAVIFSAHDGYIHAVAWKTGNPIGRIPIDSPLASSPALTADRLYAGAHDGRVVAFRTH